MANDTASTGFRGYVQTCWRGDSRICRGVVLVLGLVAGQFVLYGPSLCGSKILLPLDILATPQVLIPQSKDAKPVVPEDAIRSDLVFFYEPARQFAVSELQAGRFPFWSPQYFCGAPCFRWNVSPTHLAGYWIASPRVLAWIQLSVALAAGGGAFFFFRRALSVGYWPAVFAAWCYPLTGAYVTWQGFWLPSVMCWLPWMLLAVDCAVRRPSGWGGPAVAVVTAIALLGGAPDIGGQVLLAAGVYALWCYWDQHGRKCLAWRSWGSLLAVSAGWAIGILASAWLLLPLTEYASMGSRGMARSQGVEERPPVGLEAIPQVIMPDYYGSTGKDSLRIASTNEQESAVGAYAGLLAALFAAPLAWTSRTHRSRCILWTALACLGLSWSLGVPGMVQLLRLPGLNLMSHARFVFLTAFCILAMSAIGLDVLWRGRGSGRWWLLAASACLAALSAWCLYRTTALPEPIATEIAAAMESGKVVNGVPDAASLMHIQHAFFRSFAVASVLSALAAAAWAWLWFHQEIRRWFPALIGLLMAAELLWYGHGQAPQCDPAMYYPSVKVLEKLAENSNDRIIGFNCLPPNLSQACGLADVRGYDGVDPQRLVDLLFETADPKTNRLPYAQTQWLLPKGEVEATGRVSLSPILDMLGVRYVVFRGTPPPGLKPFLAAQDYWVLEAARSMMRAFVPRYVAAIPDRRERLRKLAEANFDARRIAYVEEPMDFDRPCRGYVSIVKQNPTQITMELAMETPGLVVVANRWDPGWTARLNDRQVPLLRVNHVLQGVAADAGRATISLHYAPASLQIGSICSAAAVAACLVWVIGIGWLHRNETL